MPTPLSDLEELILKCRNSKAKQYIQEAVLCYKANAFRSAIISTWIAVYYDIVDKIGELALAGDLEADKHKKEYDEIKESMDIPAALAFERKILIIARDKLEFVSHLDFVDLDRIQQDRNRCAHPSYTLDGEIFEASAELARTHIYSAVNILLQHPPAQGKYALDRLITEINSEYFPQEEKGVLLAFYNSPLKRPRKSLVRNLSIYLLKKVLKEDLDHKTCTKIYASLKVIKTMFADIFSETMEEKLSELCRNIMDKDLVKLFELIYNCNDLWKYLSEDIQLKMKNFIIQLPSDSLAILEHALEFSPLAVAAEQRISNITRWELNQALFFIIPSKIIDRLIEGYLQSNSYDEANGWAKIIIANAIDFNEAHVRKLLLNMSNNNQIVDSYELKNVIRELRAINNIDGEEFEKILKQNGLRKYALMAKVIEE